MPRVVHFEIPSAEPERAIEFYSRVFGWKSQRWEGPEDYWLITTGEDSQPGINGGLMKHQERFANVVNTIDVPSVDEFVAKISESGGEIVVPKFAIAGVGYLAYFKDPDGNLFGIMNEDRTAK